MKTDYSEAKEVKFQRRAKKVFYMALYTVNEGFWMNSIMVESEQEAIDSVKYIKDVSRVRVIKIELPVLTFPENIDIGETE